MQKNIFIPSRIKQIREAHNLQATQLSLIFGKERTAFAQIELGRMKLPQDFLIEIADFFAVSLDWLTGRTETPYVSEVIERLEHDLYDLFKSISLSNKEELIYFKAALLSYFTVDYFKYSGGYDLEQRANVIYALNFWKYVAIKLNNYGFNSQEISLPKVLNQIEFHQIEFGDTGMFSSKRAATAFITLCNQCIAMLDKARLQVSSVEFKVLMEHIEKNKPSAE